MVKSISKDGSLTFNKIDFEDLYTGEVKRANDNCGHIYLPKKLIGKKVYVIIKSITEG